MLGLRVCERERYKESERGGEKGRNRKRNRKSDKMELNFSVDSCEITYMQICLVMFSIFGSMFDGCVMQL